jgi:hypothetical protein
MSFFFPLIFRDWNEVTIGFWLTLYELVVVTMHTREHFMLTFLLNKNETKF